MNLFGKLTWDALPHEWYTIGGTFSLIVMGIAVAAFLTRRKLWGWLWKEWLTSTDPKKIGVMYMIVAAVMLFRGALDAAMIWAEQAFLPGAASGLSADHFQQIFTAHGVIMVFFVAMGFIFGLINLIVPLQLGARDLAFPFLNSLGFWLYAAGAALVNLFFVFGGEFAAVGWLAVAPLSGIEYSPGVGVDYWLWSLQVSGLGTLIGGINFIVTILKMRAPGMTLMKMPMFTWGSLCSMALVVSVFPILTMTTLLLFLDRYFGMHFFTSTGGGNPMMYTNLIWMWGHPEVYILIIPEFGIFSEIVATFSGKRLFGYTSAVAGVIGVTLLSFVVWLHHFFTMGAGANVNAFFGIMTMIIAVPTGALIISWVFTMFRGRIVFTTPMYWLLGSLSTFTFGGMAGVLLAIPPADFQLHNSLFLVAHFHTMAIGGALFAIFAGLTYWFPKIAGFRLDERLGKRAFWCWLVGFFVSFVPLYILGLMGATRRLDSYDVSTGWQSLFMVSALGLVIILCGVALQVWQIIVSFKNRKELRDATGLPAQAGDPWNGRTLEWSVPSPAPSYNFAVIPQVRERDAFWEMKKEGQMANGKWQMARKYEDIEAPKNTAAGIYISVFALLVGFAFVWHITWLVVLGLVGAIVCLIIRSFDEHTEHTIPAAEVERMETRGVGSK